MADFSLVPVDHDPFDPAFMAADPRYRMQPTEADQAQQAREAASYRTRNAVMPEEGRPDSGAADTLMGMVPGVDAVRHAAGGEWDKAAESAALSALPFAAGRLGPTALKVGKAIYAGGSVMSPAASAGGLIDSLPKEEQAAYADRLKQAGKIESPKRRDAEIGKINAEITAKVSARAETERALANNKQADLDWLNSTHDMRSSLKPEQQSQITAAGNLPERQALFSQFMREREEGNKTFAERHAPELEAVRAGSAIAGVAFPAYQRFRQVSALENATRDAKTSFAAASKARASRATKADLAMRTNILRENANIPSGYSEFAKELGYGSLLPYTAATFLPNALEATGRFATGTPEDRAVGLRAIGNMTDPWAIGASLGEGALATLGGQFIGRGMKNAPVAEANAKGVLSTLMAQSEAARATAAKAAATRAANRAAQASTGRSRSRSTSSP